ncbi:hypothetical protein CHIBITOTORO_00180 [Serratia phage vB_SmaM-ChibiTotoro]|nr:hypothetical protein CHIBITOTORO_00180 [Serratia phage vB_SmaM-ChibiTotoro]
MKLLGNPAFGAAALIFFVLFTVPDIFRGVGMIIDNFKADARLQEKVRVAQENVQSLYVMTPDERLQNRVNLALANVAAMERKS